MGRTRMVRTGDGQENENEEGNEDGQNENGEENENGKENENGQENKDGEENEEKGKWITAYQTKDQDPQKILSHNFHFTETQDKRLTSKRTKNAF